MSTALSYAVRQDFFKWADELSGAKSGSIFATGFSPEIDELAPVWQFEIANARVYRDGEHEEVNRLNPDIGQIGAVERDRYTGEFHARDEGTLVFEIEKFLESIKDEMVDPADADKPVAKEKMAELLNIFSRFEIKLNRRNFARNTYKTLLSRDLPTWRSFALGHHRQYRNKFAFDSWEGSPAKYPTLVSNADRYLYEKIADNDPNVMLLLQKGKSGYMSIANIFYKGNMHIAFKNVADICRIHGIAMTKSWQVFRGTMAEYVPLAKYLNDAIYLDEETNLRQSRLDGIDGYIEIADKFFHGDMNRAYVNVSAISNMSAVQMPASWRTFHGTTAEIHLVIDHVKRLDSQALLNDYYSTIAEKADRGRYASVAKMLGIYLPKQAIIPASL